ncbi:MAG: hypothetical protein WDZ37_00315 [Solirubrobacterales bacterium]
MSITRRKFVERSLALTAALSAGRLGSAIPSAAGGQTATVSAFDPINQPQLGLPPFADAAYWSFVDWLYPYFDRLWQPDRNYYGSGNSSSGRIYHNSLLLTVHAIAALAGHQGAARQDDRARALARRLCEAPPWSELTEPLHPDPQFHTPAWVESMGTRDAVMDKSIDPKVAEALMYAWRARDVLALPQETVDPIKDRVDRCARGSFFRFPGVRLNQINWNCELYAHAAAVTGNPELLVNDYRAQVTRFCDGITRPLSTGGSPNLGPGYRFFYLPARPRTHPFNLDTAEYANETAHFILYHDQALAAGMQPLTEEHKRLLRAWVEHIVYAYWTHAGYLNWDTGYGFKRWHAGRTWAFAQQGLLAIAASPHFHNVPEIGQWAKYFLDRGFILYQRLSREAGDGAGIAPAVFYDISVAPLGPSIRELTAVRLMANAARAVVLGLGAKPAPEPPPLWSYDSDIGRLAITTPKYNTAILAVNQRAIPYGGVELARLYDRDQRVAANVGGIPPASFGVVVRDGLGKTTLTSQKAKSAPPPTPALQVLGSPSGRLWRTRSYPGRPYGGAFKSLVVRGRTGNEFAAIETTHRFGGSGVETRWKVRRNAAGRFSADVLFPSWGRKATVVAVLSNGARVWLVRPGSPRRTASLRRVSYFYIAGEDGGGYVIVPRTRPTRALARILRPRKQSSAPLPGPTLAVQLAKGIAFKTLVLTVRIAPAQTPEEAAQVAKALRRGL